MINAIRSVSVLADDAFADVGDHSWCNEAASYVAILGNRSDLLKTF